MRIPFLMIACTSEALATGLETIKGHTFIHININDVPHVNYIGFRLHSDFLAFELFARKNGYAYQEMSEDNVKDLNLRVGTFTVQGDRVLAPWLLT